MHAYAKVKNSGKLERSRKANTIRNKLREKESIIKLALLSKPLYEVKKGTSTIFVPNNSGSLKTLQTMLK